MLTSFIKAAGYKTYVKTTLERLVGKKKTESKQKLEFKSEERILLLVHDQIVESRTRLQKYGFVLSQQNKSELKKFNKIYNNFEWYDDWEPGDCGPHSEKLIIDLEKCIKSGLICEIEDDINRYLSPSTFCERLFRLNNNARKEMKKLYDRIENLQKQSLHDILINVYSKYPEYIKDEDLRKTFERGRFTRV